MHKHAQFVAYVCSPSNPSFISLWGIGDEHIERLHLSQVPSIKTIIEFLWADILPLFIKEATKALK